MEFTITVTPAGVAWFAITVLACVFLVYLILLLRKLIGTLKQVDLLLSDTKTMTEIASQCGYNSLSNFYRAFHQLVGLSPKEYQQTQGFPPRNPEDFSGVSMQDQLLRLNRFQPFGELPYSFEELLTLAAFS